MTTSWTLQIYKNRGVQYVARLMVERGPPELLVETLYVSLTSRSKPAAPKHLPFGALLLQYA
jgi:hypothetical protein